MRTRVAKKKCPKCGRDLERVTLRDDAGWKRTPRFTWATCGACGHDRLLYVPSNQLGTGGSADVVVHVGGDIYDLDRGDDVRSLARSFGREFIEYLDRELGWTP